MQFKPDNARHSAALLAVAALAAGAAVAHAAEPADATPAAAEAATPDSGDAGSIGEVIVTGTRVTGLKAVDSPAPIQILSAQTLEKASGKPDLITALAQIVPSLTAQGFGGDQANQTLQAKLRGLSPNDVLILIDGKRRHTTANLAVLGGPYQGGAGTDLNFIPVDAIDHIEVLTEGAAAQYGSDAIAGVINIILKKDASGGNLSGTYGEYEDGGGITSDVAGNIGFEPIEGGYLNITGEIRNHGHSFRGGPDGRFLNPGITAPDSNAANAPGYPDLNLIQGDAEYHSKIFSFNSGIELPDGIKFYSFGTYGDKKAQSYENYRVPSTISYQGPLTGGVKNYLFPLGFSPLEATRETDYELTGGVKGEIASWNWDLSSTYGSDKAKVYTLNSANQSIVGGYTNVFGNVIPGIDATPRDFYDGFFKATQWTSNLDLNRDFDLGLAAPLNVAFGGEYRRSSYQIGAGDPDSYAGGGAQSYPGFQPADASTHSRKNYAGYVDFSTKPVEQLLVDLAGRFEHYDDFGSKSVGKLTARYDFVPEFAVRGTVSTGFRAPTLAEEYYRATNVSPDSATVQLQPNSKSAADLGLGSGLRPETSRNYSVGFVFRPLPNLSATLDVYQIDIKNRIVASGTLNSVVNGISVGPAIATAIADSGAVPPGLVVPGGSYAVDLFTNGIDTRTRGADFVLDAPVDYGWSKVDWSIGATYNDTTITSIHNAPAQLAGQPLFATGSALFDQASLSDLTTASPKYLMNFGALWTVEKLSVNVHELVYGSSTEYESDTGKTPTGTVSTITYQPNKIGVTPVTNVDISLAVTHELTLAIGANNVFNRYPNRINPVLLQGFAHAYNRATTTIYPSFSPIGIDGGYYYVRAVYSF